MIIFLYLVLVLAWAFLIILLKCKKARAKRLAEMEEEAAVQQVHVVQIGSNLYDIMSVANRNYGGTSFGYEATRNRSAPPMTTRGHTTTVTHSNPAFIDDNGGCVFPSNNLALEPPPSYEEVIRLPNNYPKVESFIPEMVVPSSNDDRINNNISTIDTNNNHSISPKVSTMTAATNT